MRSAELRQKRAALINDARGILDAAETEKRELSAEDRSRYDALMGNVDTLAADIRRVDQLAEQERSINTAIIAAETKATPEARSDPYEEVFWRYMRNGKGGLEPNELRTLRTGFDSTTEQRAQTLTSSAGGYTVPSNGVFPVLLDTARRNANIMRQVANVLQADYNTNVATVSAHGAAAWTSETSAFNDASETFGQVTFSAYKATALVKITEELVQDSIFDLPAYLAAELGKRIGVLEETAFVAGDGSSKPTGIATDAGAGITAASATTITPDELLGLLHAVDRPYRDDDSAGWMFRDSTALIIRKLKDSSGQYIWQPGLQAGQPDRLLGKPVYISDNVPAATTGLKSVLFGELKAYWIVDRAGMFIQRLDELYSENGYVGFRAFIRTDGKLTDASAVKRIIQA